jgi:hypothetical protein
VAAVFASSTAVLRARAAVLHAAPQCCASATQCNTPAAQCATPAAQCAKRTVQCAKPTVHVEAIGTHVAGVARNEPLTLFVVNHNDMSLEAFGRTGRLWRTNPISRGGFRGMALTDATIVGEARHPRWTPFSVKLATGEVRFGDGV